MGYKEKNYSSLTFGFTPSNPADATAYAFLLTDPLTTSLDRYMYFSKSVCIKRIEFLTRSGINFTDEAWTINMREYVTSTNYPLLLSKPGAGGRNSIYLNDVNITLAAGSLINFTTTTPTWATNPTNLTGYGCLDYYIV